MLTSIPEYLYRPVQIDDVLALAHEPERSVAALRYLQFRAVHDAIRGARTLTRVSRRQTTWRDLALARWLLCEGAPWLPRGEDQSEINRTFLCILQGIHLVHIPCKSMPNETASEVAAMGWRDALRQRTLLDERYLPALRMAMVALLAEPDVLSVTQRRNLIWILDDSTGDKHESPRSYMDKDAAPHTA